MELESNAEIRTTLREIFFTGAKEIDAAGKKAICVQVPVPQQKIFQKIQVSLTVQLPIEDLITIGGVNYVY